jgi:16S rRNA G966 N2-methylase RsmD
MYLLYAVAVFLSSFLLFAVQPLLGKHILPWFGGSAAVWITAMFFFMLALAIGYIYALALSWFARPLQIFIHGAFLLAVSGLLIINAAAWPSAITPAWSEIARAGGDPTVQVFLILFAAIGLPFIILSSSSSLLQHWYGRATGAEPFSLYSISNIGSLAGLLSYPLILERFLKTSEQGYWWTVGMGLYIVLSFFIMYHYGRRSDALPVRSVEEFSPAHRPTGRDFLKWMFLASVPVSAMLAGTSYITSYVATVPFLWIIPLSLYLLSFIVSFRPSPHRLPLWLNALSTLFFTFVTLVFLVTHGLPVPLTLLFIFAAMFAVFHLCHESLYQSRPDALYLTRFYVALALGGIAAGALSLLVGLYVLTAPIELLLILLGVGLYCCYRLLFRERDFVGASPRFVRLGLAFAIFAMLASTYAHVSERYGDVVIAKRNFFGYKAVKEEVTKDGIVVRSLVHGLTNHGYQYLDDSFIGVPIAYYSETSGIAAAFNYLRARRAEEGITVAVAGLGAGAILAHCRAEDRFDFFEIDPQVVALAASHFTYLEQCPKARVTLGDARLLFYEHARVRAGERYDLIVLDAYADNMMPIHLMTAEAVALYSSLLAPGGILAIHISSRYLNLAPVIAAVADENKLYARRLHNTEHPSYAVPSYWTLLSPSPIFHDEAFAAMDTFDGVRRVLWSDTYSTLVPLFKW